MKKVKKKKKTDYSILIHCIFIIIFIFVIFALYVMSGRKNVPELLESTEQAYKNKITAEKPSPKPQPQTVQAPPFTKYSYTYGYKINVSGRLKSLTFRVPLPYDETEKQYITDSSFSINPTRIYNDNGNTFAEFILENLNNETVPIVLKGIANVRTYDYKTASLINKNIGREHNLDKYLKPEPFIESDDAEIINTAKKMTGSTQEEIVDSIYNFVVKNLEYTIIPGTLGAKKALRLKKGKCSEYAALMTALCRARNIPARVVLGHMAKETGNPKHGWVEVYYDKYGWVTYEPTERPTIIIKHNAKGEVISRESKIESEKSNVQYIASAIGQFTPWSLSYSVTKQSNGTARVEEKLDIHKIE